MTRPANPVSPKTATYVDKHSDDGSTPEVKKAGLVNFLRATVQAIIHPQQRNLVVIARLVLLTQIIISVTGSMVRVTGSGLGCTTWPQCFPGSFTPVPRSAVPMWHQLIEFGNRQIAVWLVCITSLILMIMVYRAHSSGRIKVLAWCMPIGVIVQAILGGMTVLYKLVWWLVGLHMVASLVMIWIAAQLCSEFNDNTVVLSPRKAMWVHVLATVGACFLAATVIIGACTTGAGPLAGDESSDHPVQRLVVPIKTLLALHTFSALTYLAIITACSWIVFHNQFSAHIKSIMRAIRWVVFAQISIGILQTILHLPPVLVVLHVCGACGNVACLSFLFAATASRKISNNNTALASSSLVRL